MEIAITILALIALIGGAWFYFKKKKKDDELEEEAKEPRLPSKNKTLYYGVVLSDYRGDFPPYPDGGWFKGWVCGPKTAVITRHSNPSAGKYIHTYTEKGKKIKRKVIKVIKPDFGFKSDIAIVRVDQPWGEGAKISKIASSTPDSFYVLHKDGGKTTRKLGSTEGFRVKVSRNVDDIDRFLVAGESGLPWVAFSGEVVSHTHTVNVESGPNYPAIKALLEKEIEKLENGSI